MSDDYDSPWKEALHRYFPECWMLTIPPALQTELLNNIAMLEKELAMPGIDHALEEISEPAAPDRSPARH